MDDRDLGSRDRYTCYPGDRRFRLVDCIMGQRRIDSDQLRDRAIDDIRALSYPYFVTVTAEKTRSSSANARYWALMQENLDAITATVERLSEETGHTPLEIRRHIAAQLTPEHAAILYAVKKEAAHEILKLICGVPTSTRLGTKKFKKFEAIMEATLADILGEVNAEAAIITKRA